MTDLSEKDYDAYSCIKRFVRIAYFNMLQYTPIIVSTHANEREKESNLHLIRALSKSFHPLHNS